VQPSTSGRILAAVLFTDMVNSTSIAEELGDSRWKTVVDRHHVIVRRELKRFGGRELDTAGDGFFASFREPAPAIECACAAADAVRELGIEIRSGVHFGECTRIGRKLGGITVVVGARIMTLGGAGDVLVSSTAAELARGAGFGVEDRGLHVLKGVDEEWRVAAVVSVDGKPRSAPLDRADAETRLARIQPDSGHRRRRTPIIATAVAVAIAAVSFVVVLNARTEALVPGPDTVARIDARSGTFNDVIAVGSHAFPDGVASGAGRLWVISANDTLSAIDTTSSNTTEVFGTPSTPTGIAFADGRVWVTYGFSSEAQRRIDVLDPSMTDPGLVAAPFSDSIPDGSYPIAAGAGALWIADPLGSTVIRYDLGTGDPPTSLALPNDTGPIDLRVSEVGTSPSVWVAGGRVASVFRANAVHTQRPVEAFGTGNDVPTALAVAPGGSVWTVGQESDSVSALSPSGTSLVHQVLADRCDGPTAIAVTTEAVWVSCSVSKVVARLDPSDGSIVAVLPVAAVPGPMTVDDQGAVWVTLQ
jgi:class 3 adenylate cyclase/streptogramin lyase